MNVEGMISLGGGYPNASLFPLKQVSLSIPTVEDPQLLEQVVIPKTLLEQGLQYSSSFGLGSTIELLKTKLMVRSVCTLHVIRCMRAVLLVSISI